MPSEQSIEYEKPVYVTEKEDGSISFDFSPSKSSGIEVVNLGGEEVRIVNEQLPLNILTLDADNPRIESDKINADVSGKRISEEKVESFLREKNHISELKEDIIRNGGLSNAIYIRNNGIVIEGNRRTVALRDIEESVLEGNLGGEWREFLQNIPVKILPDDISSQAIDEFLAREHVVGKRDWEAFEKASHIYNMYKSQNRTMEDVAEIVGRSQGWVSRRIHSYKWTKEYLENDDFDDNSNVYSHFDEAYKFRNQLKEANFDVMNSEEDREELGRLIYNGRLPSCTSVRKLNKIYEYPETKEKFEEGWHQEALDLVEELDPESYGQPFKSLNESVQRMKSMTEGEVEKAEDFEWLFKEMNELSSAILQSIDS